MPALADSLVELGKRILHEYPGKETGYFIQGGVSWLFYHLLFAKQGENMTSVWQRYDRVVGNINVCDILRQYIAIAQNVLNCDVVRLMRVMAVKAVLVSWQGATMSATAGADETSSIDAGLDPHVFGVGAGIKSSWGADENAKWSQSLAVAVVPVLSLIDQVIAWLCPTGIPDISTAIDLYTHNVIDFDHVHCLITLNGGRWDEYAPVITNRSWQVIPENAIMAIRLAGGGEAQVNEALKRSGYVNDFCRATLITAFDRPVSPAEAFAATETMSFQDEWVRRYRLDEGFLDQLWGNWHTQLEAQGVTEDVARTQWRTHWTLPGLGELRQLWYRLQPGVAPAGLELFSDDVDRLLRSQGYTSYFRERWQAILYEVPSVRQHAQSVMFDQYDMRDVRNALRKGGYNADDSTKLATGYYYLGVRRKVAAAKGMTAGTAFRLLMDGVQTLEQVTPELLEQGYTEAQIARMLQLSVLTGQAMNKRRWGLKAINEMAGEALHAYEVGAATAEVAMSALLAAGCPPDSASILLQRSNLRVREGIVKAGVTAIKRAVLIGGLTAVQAATALVQLGIAGPRAEQYIAEWTALLTFPRRVASAQKILSWAEQGYLPIPVAEQRLASLGWGTEDIAMMLTEIRAKVGALQEKASLARQKQAAAAAKAAATAQKQAQQLVTQTQAIVRRYWSLSRVKSLFAKHIITEAAMRERMREGGFTDEEIQTAVAEAKLDRERADAAVAKHGATGIEHTGPPVE